MTGNEREREDVRAFAAALFDEFNAHKSLNQMRAEYPDADRCYRRNPDLFWHYVRGGS